MSLTKQRVLHPPSILLHINDTVNAKRDLTYVVWHDHEGKAKKSYTFGQLYDQAGRIGQSLLENTKWNLQRGDRVVLCYNFGLNFFAAFLACLRVGIVPVLVYPPSKPLAKSLPRLNKVIDDCNAKIVLSDTDICLLRRTDKANLLSESRKLWPASTTFVDTTKLANQQPKQSSISTELSSTQTPQPDHLAFLQYTSGSTGEPKGIMVTHGALAANVQAIGRAMTTDFEASYPGGVPDQITGCTFLPPYHDMGLVQAIIAPFVHGYKVHMMSPLSFIRNPLLWIQLMSTFKVHWTVAPDFAYRLVTKKFLEAKAKRQALQNLDLSSLHILQSGAEPVRADTKTRFEQAFEGYGLSNGWFGTGYGLAENVVFVSFTHDYRLSHRHKTNDNFPPFVAVGHRQTLSGVEEMRIVDPETNLEVMDGERGELWVAGPSIAAGYLGHPDLTRETFQARLNHEDSSTTYLRTGDLAFFDEEGYLYICGRIKDLIVYNGQNLYPQDLEHAIEALGNTSVRPGCVAAFSSDESGRDGAVEIVFEIRRLSEFHAFEVCRDVAAAISSSCGIMPVRVVAITEKSICKTTSGKIQRRATREALHLGELPTVFDWSPGSSNGCNRGTIQSKENLLHVLATHATTQPDHQVFTWVDDKGKESTSLTYAELWNKSMAVMKLLQRKKVKPGERVIIAYPFGLEFLAGIFGAMLAECVPCSVYPPNPSKLATDMPRFQEIVTDAEATLALTTTQFARAMKAASLIHKSSVTWLPTDRLPNESKMPYPKEYSIEDLEKPALIQYTSGSTSKPKGVVLSHKCLFNNGKAITEAGGFTINTNSVIWAPQYHDMGLIVGFFTSLFSGSRLYAFSPLVFLKNPLLWDDLVRRYQAHATIAPNFGYALLLKRLRESNRSSDWSFMKRASLAAEPTTEDVVNGVHNELGVANENIWNVYGMAECGVFITGGPTFSQDGVMSCGPLENGVSSVRVVDSSGHELPPGQEGLIWVRSELVANGYLNHDKLTSDAFHNSMEGETGNWLNTGDLGKAVNGNLFVSGRQKEVMIIAGVNHYPTDVEGIVNSEFGKLVRAGRTAAFEFSSQSIGLVCELQSKEMPKAKVEKLLLDIKRLVQHRASLEVGYVAALKQGCVPKTTSGKLKRTLIKKKVLEGDWRTEEILFVLGARGEQPTTTAASAVSPKSSRIKVAVPYLGSSFGTGCPHAKFGGLKEFYANNNGSYSHASITEHATTDVAGIHAELKHMDTAFPAGLIDRDPYEAGAFRFADHRFWSDAQGRARPFALGNPYQEKVKARSWIAGLLDFAPDSGRLQESAASFLEEHASGRSFKTSSIEKFVCGILYHWLFQEEATQAFIDEFVTYQWKVFDMVMKPHHDEGDSAVLRAKKSYVETFRHEKGLTEEQASWAMDLLLFPGIQVTFLLRCGLGAQYSKRFQQQPYQITQENVFQFVWECIRMFPPFPALPWWRDGERHLIVLAMTGMDQKLFGSDAKTFKPDRITADQFDERSCFFAEQSQLFRCPAKSFALKLASAFFLEFSKTGPWKSDSQIEYADVQPYFNDFILKRAPKVVVVGGGVAGLTCALRLAQRGAAVTVVEKNDMIGGHSRHAEFLGGHIRNPAFGAFQVDQWPNAVAVMDELQVQRISHGKASEFATRFARDGHTIPSPSQSTIAKFFADMKQVYASGCSTQTIGQFLEERGYDDTFLYGFFFGAIIHHFAGLSIREYLEIPVHLVAWLALGDSRFSETDIYRVRNEEYMKAFVDKLKSLNVALRLGCSAEVVSRDDQRCHLQLNRKEDLFCDQLVFATPPDAAINILGPARTSEELLLQSFDCRKETAVFHRDAAFSDPNGSPLAVMMPNQDAGWPSRDQTLPMTTHILSDTDNTTSIYATYSYANYESLPISGDREHMTFTHVRITRSAEFLRNRLLESQGRNNTYFAGGWTRGLMLHEDAVVSGTMVANSILEAWGEKSFVILNRKVELIDTTAASPLASPAASKQIDFITADDKNGDTKDQSKIFDEVLASVFGYDFHQDSTWADIGLSSVMSVELGDAIAKEFQITLPADWVSRCPTAASLKKFVLNHQRVPIPTALPELKRIFSTPLPWPLFGFLQLIGCAITVIVFAFPFVLSFYLASLLSQHDGPMILLYPLILPVWVFTFSLTLVATKWIVVGRYIEGQVNAATLTYLRWWLVDRMVDLWESLIGQYILETPLINIVYILAGANIDPSVKMSSFIREFDLVTIEQGTSLSFCIRPRRFGRWEKDMVAPVLRFRPVWVGKNCDVEGLVALGSNLGDHVVVKPKAVIAEGGQVPSNCTVEGNLASISGEGQLSSKPAAYQWWQLGLLKMLWQVVMLYLFFAGLAAAHFLVSSHIPSHFRYTNILAFVVDLVLGSIILLLTVIPSKWLIIGKRRPGPYQDSLYRAIADYAIDYTYGTSFTFLNLHYTNSRLWNLYFRALGMKVDMRSKFFALSFAPSNADLITMRDTFASTSHWETKHDGEYHKIDVNESSVGWDVTLGPGVSVSRAAIPPHTYVQQNVLREDPDDRNRVVALRQLFKEEVERFILMTIALGCTFMSLIPSAEVWQFCSPDPASSPLITALVLALVMVLQTVTWLLLARILQYFVYLGSSQRSAPWSISVYASFESGYRWAIIKYSLLRLFAGGPLFNCYAAFSGATMEGRTLFVGNPTIYDGNYVTIADRTVIDSAVVDGHFQIFHDLNLGPSRASGTLHPFTLVGCNSLATAAETGPCKFVTANHLRVVDEASYATDLAGTEAGFFDEESQLHVETRTMNPTPDGAKANRFWGGAVAA